MSLSANYPTVRPSLLLDFANSKRLDPRITFTRATTGTYFDDKPTVRGDENLAFQSQTINSSPWGASNGSVTANDTTAPDGTTTADRLSPSGSTVITSVSQGAVVDTTHTSTISVYAKANSINHIWIISGNKSSAAVWFNVSAGTVGTTAGGYTASIVSVGSGWYRCIVTGTFNSLQIGISSSDGIYTSSASGSNGVYLWGVQVEARSSATAYVSTTSALVSNSVYPLKTATAGAARFDHDPVTGASLGLLIETTKTNTITNSTSGFISSGTFMTATTITAVNPAGVVASIPFGRMDSNGSVATTYVNSSSFSASTGTRYTASVFVKAYGRGDGSDPSPTGFTWHNFGDSTGRVGYTLSGDGTVTIGSDGGSSNCKATIRNVGNGWYRCSFTWTHQSGDNTSWYWSPTRSVGNFTNQGDGWSGLMFWGYQLEESPAPSSYIPTSGSGATRNADIVRVTGGSFTDVNGNSPEGVLYAEQVVGPSTGIDTQYGNNGAFAVWYNNDNFIAIGAGVGAGGDIDAGKKGAYWVNRLSQQQGYAISANLVNAYGTLKTALSYKTNELLACTNEVALTSDTASVVLPHATQFNIGSTYGGYYAEGWIKKVAFYPETMTAAQLKALTKT